ncbi:MAG: transporter substrate-binding domain-containing protein [Bacterioplanes sp.]|nr:transporter substrate-binding domain-containing protein [Bacterioplanes sp.]
MRHACRYRTTHCLLLWLSLCFTGLTVADTAHFKLGGMHGHPLNPLGVTILTEAYAELGITIELVALPSPRSMELAHRGLLDGELGRIDGVTDMYPNLLKVDWPIIDLDTVAITSHPTRMFDEKPNLLNYRLGIVRGARINERVTYDPDNAVEVTHSEQLIRMLHTQRIDLAIMPRSVALLLLKQDPELRILEPSLGVHPIHHYLHRRHHALVPKLQQILQRMAKEGRIAWLEQQFLQQK